MEIFQSTRGSSGIPAVLFSRIGERHEFVNTRIPECLTTDYEGRLQLTAEVRGAIADDTTPLPCARCIHNSTGMCKVPSNTEIAQKSDNSPLPLGYKISDTFIPIDENTAQVKVLSGATLLLRAIEDGFITLEDLQHYCGNIATIDGKTLGFKIWNDMGNYRNNPDLIDNSKHSEIVTKLIEASKIPLPRLFTFVEANGTKRLIAPAHADLNMARLYGIYPITEQMQESRSIKARATRAFHLLYAKAGAPKQLSEMIRIMVQNHWLSEGEVNTATGYFSQMVNTVNMSGCARRSGRKLSPSYAITFNPLECDTLKLPYIRPSDLTPEILYPNNKRRNIYTEKIPGCENCELSKGCGQLAYYHFALLGLIKEYYKAMEPSSHQKLTAMIEVRNENKRVAS